MPFAYPLIRFEPSDNALAIHSPDQKRHLRYWKRSRRGEIPYGVSYNAHIRAILPTPAQLFKYLACGRSLCQTGRMKRTALACCLLLSAAPLRADPMMSAEAFDAYTRGKTFYYASQGAPYGAEEYLSDRRVRWSFLTANARTGAGSNRTG